MKVNYVSACLDASGYADAARNYIAALKATDIKVDVTALTFEKFRSDLGKLGTMIKNMIVENSVSDINIIHTTPTIFPKVKIHGKYNIGCTTWETTKLPQGWADACNHMNELWVPCKQNVEVFRESGVKIPIHLIPHAFSRELFEEETDALQIQNQDQNFTFYSVFQWTERKNPVDILKAYLTEFKAHENVCLLLKTYMFDPGSEAEKGKIKAIITEIKEKLYLKNYPKILLISSLLSKPQVNAIHKHGDCYLSFHRNEGFGIPIIEAMMAGKPVICTGYGGPADFVTKETGFPVPWQMTPCFGMPWDTYTGEMEWADINIMEARKSMRWVYNNREAAKQIGLQGQKFVDENFSWKAVGQLMKERLESI